MRGWICLVMALASCAAEAETESLADESLEASEEAAYEDQTDDASDATTAADVVKMVLVHAGETEDAELVETLPIATSENGAARRVVMRIGPDKLPDLAAGDRLIAPAEVQVTTRCDVGQTAPGCNYNPMIRAQLILGGKALSAPKTLSCTKAEHHCMFVFAPNEATQKLDALPCVADGSCHVDLVMWAWHPAARAGGQDKVLVGENEGDYLANGIVGPDKGRLMVIRERGIEAADRTERETTGGGSIGIPTTTAPIVIYSHPLEGLARHEQFLIEAKIVTEVGDRARFSTQMFLTKDPKATSGGSLQKVVPTQIGEHNGINCTSGTSPCTTRKVAVFRAADDIAGPVYVNIVAKSDVPGGGTTQVTVKRNEGWLRSRRYQAAHKQ